MKRWSGIINPECAIDVMLQILNTPYKKQTLKYISLNMNAWYLSKETSIKLFECIRRVENEHHIEKLNLSCLYHHPIKKNKFNNPNGRVFGKNLIKLISYKDQQYKKAIFVCKAIDNTQLYLTERMQKEFYKLCFVPHLNEVKEIQQPFSYNIQG